MGGDDHAGQSMALEESCGGCHGQQDDDEDIDLILEEQLAVSVQRQAPLPPAPSNESPVSSCASTLLKFAFPGWAVDIFRDPKRRRPSIVRHEQLEKGLESDGKESQLELSLEVRWKKKGSWGDAERPGDGSTVYKLPDELLANVMQRLGIRDLCSSIQTCQWWQRVGSQDEIWETFCQALKDDVAASSLPKWAMIKNGVLSDQVKKKNTLRYACSWKGFDRLRCALRSWWENGRPDNQYSSRILHFLIQKMTAVDWCLVYEFLGVMLTERADYLANILMEELSKVCRRNQHNAGHFFCDQISVSKELDSKIVNTAYEVPMSSDSCSAEKLDCKIQAGLIGIEMWKHVNALWNQYKQWLNLVFTHCSELNYEVRLERNRSKTRSTTPTVYEKGVICFRGQVLLKYGLRKMLQLGFSWLEMQVANGTASEIEFEQLHSIYHLLQEVDVLDDSMLSQRNFTQSKLRRCFPVKRSYHRVE